MDTANGTHARRRRFLTISMRCFNGLFTEPAGTHRRTTKRDRTRWVRPRLVAARRCLSGGEVCQDLAEPVHGGGDPGQLERV